MFIIITYIHELTRSILNGTYREIKDIWSLDMYSQKKIAYIYPLISHFLTTELTEKSPH